MAGTFIYLHHIGWYNEHMIPEDRLQEIIENKDADRALAWCSAFRYVEGWSICDGALVIYDVDDPPKWFRFKRDDDGNSVA